MSGKRKLSTEELEARARKEEEFKKLNEDGLSCGVTHNQVAFLNATKPVSSRFAGVIQFLLRSRIRDALLTERTCYFKAQRDFWESVTVDKDADPISMHATVEGKDVVVTEEHVRRCLHLGDASDLPILLSRTQVRGLLQRVKYGGPITKGVVKMAMFSAPYRFLAFILMRCLGNRRATHDDMRETIQSAYAALILNLPYNFSGMIFFHLVENAERKMDDRFLMYPRFLQIIFEAQHTNLPHTGPSIPIEPLLDTSYSRITSYKRQGFAPIEKRLIGHLANPNYAPPAGDRWRHEDSDSDTEDIVPTDLGGDGGDGGDGGGPPAGDEGAGDSERTEDDPSVMTVKRRRVAEGGEGDEHDDDLSIERLFGDVPDEPFIGDVTSRLDAVLADVNKEEERRKEKAEIGRVKHMATKSKKPEGRRIKLTRKSDRERAVAEAARARGEPTPTPQTTQPTQTPQTPTPTHTFIPTPGLSQTQTETQAIPSTQQLLNMNSMIMHLLAQQAEQKALWDVYYREKVEQDRKIDILVQQNADQALQLTSQANEIADLRSQNEERRLLIEEQSRELVEYKKKVDEQQVVIFEIKADNLKQDQRLDVHDKKIEDLEDMDQQIEEHLNELRPPELTTGQGEDQEAVEESNQPQPATSKPQG